MNIVMATLVSVQPFSIQMKKNILHASVNQVSREMQMTIVLVVIIVLLTNLFATILLKFMTTLQMTATKRNIVNQDAPLSCQSNHHGLVFVQMEHTDTKENVSKSARQSVVLTKIELNFTAHATKDIAATKARSITNTLVYRLQLDRFI